MQHEVFGHSVLGRDYVNDFRIRHQLASLVPRPAICQGIWFSRICALWPVAGAYLIRFGLRPAAQKQREVQIHAAFLEVLHTDAAVEPGHGFCRGSAVTAQALSMALWRTLEGAICDPHNSVRRDWIGVRTNTDHRLARHICHSKHRRLI